MRFLGKISTLILCLSFHNLSLAVMAVDEHAILLGGGSTAPSGLSGQCVTQLKFDLVTCQREPSQTAAFACQGRADRAVCATDVCMKEKNYPSGIDTDAASFCVRSIPRIQNNQDVQNNNIVIRRPSHPTVQTPEHAPVPTPRPSQNPATERTAPAPTANWQQESAQDVQQCSSTESSASRCCNNPNSCSSELTDSQKSNYLSMAQAAKNSGDAAGLQEICRQSRQAGFSSSSINTGFANICYSKHSTCTEACGGALTKWQNRLNNCGANCDRPLVVNTVNALITKKNSCRSYAAIENQIRSQSYAAADDTALSNLCARSTSTASASQEDEVGGQGQSQAGGGGGGSDWGFQNPGGMGALAPGQQQQQQVADQPAASAAQHPCAVNPYGPGCYGQQTPTTGGAISQQTPTSLAGPSDFNVGTDNNFDSQNPGDSYIPSESITPQQQSAHAIQNGGGGFISGGQSANPTQASQGPDLPAMLGSGVNPNSKTDILDGTQGGGGYSQAARSDGSGFENKYGAINMKFNNGARTQEKNYKGLDLKRFLPGGKEDPKRNLAGLSAFHPDIGPMHVDFFQRISTRLQTLCKLKRLLDCQ